MERKINDETIKVVIFYLSASSVTLREILLSFPGFLIQHFQKSFLSNNDHTQGLCLFKL